MKDRWNLIIYYMYLLYACTSASSVLYIMIKLHSYKMVSFRVLNL